MILKDNGVSIILAVFVLLLLSVTAVALFSLVSTESETGANQAISRRALYIGEGGINYASQFIADDQSATAQTSTPTTAGYCALAYLDGGFNSSSSTSGGANPDRAAFKGSAWDTASDTNFCTLNSNNDSVTIWNFQQRINYIGATIKQVDIITRANKASGGSAPTIQMAYSTNGGGAYTNVGSAITMTNTFTFYTNTISGLTWQTIMDSTNFRLKITRSGGNRNAQIDWLALRVTYQVDAITEPWFDTFMNSDSSAKTLNYVLGNGNIKTITISDEQGKVNLNYASQTLLQQLFTYEGVSSPSTVAANVVTYRGTQQFRTVEELQQVSGMTTANYNLIKPDVTVYSWINQNVTIPTGSRAPVNVNTASSNVLRAIFRTAITDETDISSLASAIRTQVQTAPFTNMFSSYSQQNAGGSTDSLKSFSYFIKQEAYLSNTQRLAIREFVDGSQYNMTLTGSWDGTSSTGTEFCYSSNTFLITAVGTSGSINQTIVSTFGGTYNYTTFLFGSNSFKVPAFIGQTAKRYWRNTR